MTTGIRFILLRLCSISVLTLLAMLNAHADDDMRHIIQRGETWTSICRDYGITFDGLQQSNPWIETGSDCPVGLEVNIPVVGPDGDRMVNKLLATDSRYIEAEALFNAGEYKKAVKIYDRIIKNEVGPYAAMFLRGRAQFYRGKYGRALDDFSSADAMTFSSMGSLRDEAARLKVEQDERRGAMWGAIALGVAQAGVEITGALMAKEQQKSVEQNRERIAAQYEIVTPAGNVIRPPESIIKSLNGEYNTGMQVTYDQFGNPMFSSEGTARMMEDMARENVQITEKSLAGNPNSAIAKSMAIMARGDYNRAMQEAQYWRTPHYAPDAETMREINADLAAENDRRRKERMEEREADRRDLVNKNKALTEAMLNHTTSSSSYSSGSTSVASASSRPASAESSKNKLSTTVASSGSRTSSQNTMSTEETDDRKYRQQFKNEKVSSDDYDEIKKVNLYIQDGSSFNIMIRNAPLFKKGAQMFVKIGGTYFLRMRSNTSRFNSMIVYGQKGLYFSE